MSAAECFLTESSAPLLQPVWELMQEHQNLLLSPFYSVGAGFLVHVLLSTPFLLLDLLSPHLSWINRFKVTGETVTFSQWLECLQRIFWKYVVGLLPFTAFLQLIRYSSFSKKDCTAPSLFLVFSEGFSCLLVFDTLFFFIHYTAHRNVWLYRNIHQSHHFNRDTFALAAQDSSLTELLLQQALAIFSAMLVDCHPLSEVMFHLSNIWLGVEDHCGYDFPWALHRLLPCFGGPPYHQVHHQHFRGNYAPYFTHWDLIFGTSLSNCMHSSNTSDSAYKVLE